MNKNSVLRSSLLVGIHAAGELNRRKRFGFDFYQPSNKQRDFHVAGRDHRERVLLAGNQLGKTLAASVETAIHLTGRYPSWWEGKRFSRPIKAWAASVSSEATRDNPQRALLGEALNSQSKLEAFRQAHAGDMTKVISDDDLNGNNADVTERVRRAAIHSALIKRISATSAQANAVDGIWVKHVSGGTSQLHFKSYSQGREKWQGPSLDLVWFDEEPPYDIYLEGLTRTNATEGICYVTFTPLQGVSAMLSRFWSREGNTEVGHADRKLVRMTLSDATHYSAQQKSKLEASYDAAERSTRLLGLPDVRRGRVFAQPLDEVTLPPEELIINDGWAWIAGIDFGWDHPTAAVLLGFDRDNDRVVVQREYCQSGRTAAEHASEFLSWGKDIRWAWPQDGLQTEKGSGKSLRQYYSELGLNMLPDPARFVDGGNSVEVGIMQMLERMRTGRLKVLTSLSTWAEEYQGYHRKEGRIVAKKDDVLCATRYALMCLRFAQPRVLNGGTDRLQSVANQDFDPHAW